jgi:undecaprenyl-diphosphatase
MTYLQILILALIQGAAELLPVSSSAHVIFAEHVMGLDPAKPEMTFLLVMLHTGTMVAVLVYFWPRWQRLVFPSAKVADSGPAQRFQFPLMVLLATVCTGVLGYGLKLFIEKVILVRLLGQDKGEIEELFRNLYLMAASLFAVGIFIIVAGSRRQGIIRTLTPQSSVLIGIVQGLCLPFRGFSRSGATISTGLCYGLTRSLAEDFSFALAVVLTPAVIVLELYRLLKAAQWQSSTHLMDLLLPGLVGMVFSCISGFLALKFLSAVLEKGRWKYFGYYCLVAALVVLIGALCGLGSHPPSSETSARTSPSAACPTSAHTIRAGRF